MTTAKDTDFRERLKTRRDHIAAVNPPFPQKDMLIELRSGCNHRCIFCAGQKSTLKSSEISPEQLARILHDAYDSGIKEVGFYSTSEPFLCSNLEEYVLLAKKIGFEYVYITTNGALATEDRLKKIIDNGLDSLKFSINAGTRETYHFIHGFDDFDKVIDMLRFCHEYRQTTKSKIHIYISYIITRFNAHEVEYFKKKYMSLCDDIAFYPIINFGGLVPETQTHIAPPIEGNKSARYNCHFLFKSIRITSEGYLTACGCADYQRYLIVGDLNTTSLRDAWYGEKFTQLRQRYIDDSLEGLQCYNCVYGKSENFQPLSPEYATEISMEQVFTTKHLDKRLERFPKFKEFA